MQIVLRAKMKCTGGRGGGRGEGRINCERENNGLRGKIKGSRAKEGNERLREKIKGADSAKG